ncbi:Smr/MutS family protein [Tropicimonas sp. IMCC34011]|uniref:Smr/MutS family protein n=1 Tax=Tropicimonas sp. IMCC34011 TaxID=2248759 RepID=UPI001E4A5C73|nr:Smr/MutS family protein [Tropicimonas sp. IMCC34011]
MSRRRKLSDDDLAVWREVSASVRRTAPLPKSMRAHEKPSEGPQPQKDFAPDALAPPIPPFRLGERSKAPRGPATTSAPAIESRLRAAPVTMDAKAHRRMVRGKLRPEAKIDLHGMTLSAAHPVLVSFILRAASDGKRLVLVVTGKGRDRPGDGPIPVPRGILRHQVPDWLRLPPLGPVVQQITPAHERHGGSGAYYVYLARRRG